MMLYVSGFLVLRFLLFRAVPARIPTGIEHPDADQHTHKHQRAPAYPWPHKGAEYGAEEK